MLQKIYNYGSAGSMLALLLMIIFGKGCTGNMDQLVQAIQSDPIETTTEVIKEVEVEVLRVDTVTEIKWKTLKAATVVEVLPDTARRRQDSLIINELTGLLNDENKIFDPSGGAIPDEFSETSETLREWSGGTQDENVILSYEATTKGTLESIDLSYKLKKPLEVLKVVKQAVFETPSDYRSGFYLGAQYNHTFPWIGRKHMSLSALASYTSKSGWLIGYQYSPTNNAHSVGFGRRLFEFSLAKSQSNILKPTEAGHVNRLYIGAQYNQEIETGLQTISGTLDLTINSGWKIGYQYRPYRNIHSFSIAKRLIPFKNN